MMVVLLIVAIVAAATAPMVTKKMARNAGSGDSPWVFTGLGGNIAYNMGGNDNSTVLIGTSTTPNGWTGHARLFVDSGNNAAHIAFGHGNDTPLLLTADPAGRIGFSNAQIPANSVAFGTGQTITGTGHVAIGRNLNFQNNCNNSIIIGQNGETNSSRTIVIGSSATEDNRPYASASDAIAIGSGTEATGVSAIAIGGQNEQRTTASGARSIAIGTHITDSNIYGLTQTQATGTDSIAIGTNATSTGSQGVAIGRFAQATGASSLAIGPGYKSGDASASTRATAETSMALGFNAAATAEKSMALGYNANAKYRNSVAIGPGETTASYQIAIGTDYSSNPTHEIILGSKDTIVTIPGFLKVGKNTVLGYSGNSYRTFVRHKTYGKGNWWLKSIEVESGGGNDRFRWGEDYSESAFKKAYTSDRRLKNVGEKYTAGLDELKKLEFFHYTFKKDENKTPMVGVMAQDLQKVFPDAVTKGDDGYLRIRLEDMFYAVINAVKELDSKIAQIVENISDINSKIENLEKENAELQKVNSDLVETNEELKAEIKNIEKRIEKLEK